MEQQKKQPDYNFDVFIINPNTLDKSKYDFFNENIYDILSHNEENGTLNDIETYKPKLKQYLEKKDYIQTKNVSFDKLLYEIELYMNPNKLKGRSFEVKTCLNNDKELIMFTYDAENKNLNQYNHIGTIFGPDFEPIFGPIFITKIIKDADRHNNLKHSNINLDDFIDLWISFKQITYWNFENNNWSKQIMFNNNKQLNNSANYKYVNINNYIVFYKYNSEQTFESKEQLTNFIKTNLHLVDILSEKFINIKICRLRTGEYIDEQLDYNTDLSGMHEHIANTTINALEDYSKYQIIMESIFQNISENLVL